MYENTLEYARRQDEDDVLRAIRQEFLIPENEAGKQLIYLCGNSLGLQPKNTSSYINKQLQTWQNLAVEGWFEGKISWIKYGREVARLLMDVVGGNESEITVMNSLTVNLHLLFTSFYQPDAHRYKVLMEANAFPSDTYMVKSQARLYGFDEAIIELKPNNGGVVLETKDILASIDKHADELAMVFIGGVNYFTGQVFDMQAIAKKCRKKGIICGLDLAHAIGNVPLLLHRWDVDFAAWCSYKYLNAGPGGISGVFIHEKHHKNEHKRLEGWWGNNLNTRFKMAPEFDPAEGAAAWQVSTAPILLLALHHAALDVLNKAGGVAVLREKSIRLTGYLEFLLDEIGTKNKNIFQILTPKNAAERGCQLSLQFKRSGKDIFTQLSKAGVIGDWREPDVIRLSPVPSYNTFEEVFLTAKILDGIITQ